MAERRSCQLVINMEPSLYALVVQQTQAEGKAMSEWGRGLVIRRLVADGRLDVNKMTNLVTGDSESELARLMELANADNHPVAEVSMVRE